MSNNELQKRERLIWYLQSLPRGTPFTTAKCEQEWNVSRQSVHWYALKKWLDSLGHGYYIKHGETPTITGTVAALETSGLKVHISGKSALGLKGFSHYVSLRDSLVHLYGRQVRQMPKWLNNYWMVMLSTKKLFTEPDELTHRLYVRPFEEDPAPYVSDPERAILEMLDDIPQEQTLSEAKEIMEGMFSLNPEKMESLLVKCERVRVKRLFWHISKELGLPVIDEINKSKIDFGSTSPYILKYNNKTMVLKNPVTEEK